MKNCLTGLEPPLAPSVAPCLVSPNDDYDTKGPPASLEPQRFV